MLLKLSFELAKVCETSYLFVLCEFKGSEVDI